MLDRRVAALVVLAAAGAIAVSVGIFGVGCSQRARDPSGSERTRSSQQGLVIGPAWVTRSYSPTRAGANPSETVLTQKSVNSNSFGFRLSLPVDDEVLAQVLYVSAASAGGGLQANTTFVATTDNSVYAFGDNGQLFWARSDGTGNGLNTINGTTYRAARTSDLDAMRLCSNFDRNVGIVGTPTIDLSTGPGTLYVVTHTYETNNGVGKVQYRLRALNIVTGADQPNSPSAPLSASGFDASNENQRAGLAESNGAIYIAFGAYCDGPAGYHGFIFSYDAAQLTPIAATTNPFNSTPQGAGLGELGQGGIWQGGNAPVIDPNDGSLYVAIGNGDFNANTEGGQDYGEAVVHLASRTLAVTDYFEPYNFSALNGTNDHDIGSAAPVLMPINGGSSVHEVLVQACKGQGRVYVLNAANLGHISSSTTADTNILQEWNPIQDLLPNPPAPPDDAYNVFNGVVINGTSMYVAGSTDDVRMFVMNQNTGTFNTSGSSFTLPSNNKGGVMSLSSNNSAAGTSVLWVLNLGSGCTTSTQCSRALFAFPADNPTFGQLWSSTSASADALPAGSGFSPPTVVNGRVFVGGSGPGKGSVSVYGLNGGGGTLVRCRTCNINPNAFATDRIPWLPPGALKPVALAAGSSGAIYARSLQNGSWTVSGPLTATAFAPPGAGVALAQATSSQADAFVVASNGALYVSTETNGGPWQSFTALTATNFAPPGASIETANQAGVLGVALVDLTGALQAFSWTASGGWVGPVPVTNAGYAPPGANLIVGARSSGELDTFTLANDGSLQYVSYYAGVWGGPTALSGPSFAPPGGALATAADRYGALNVFNIANDGALYTTWDNYGTWTGPVALTATGLGPPAGSVAAIQFRGNLWAFLVDNQGTLDSMYYAGGANWTSPAAVGTNLTQPGSAVSVAPESSTQLDLFALGVGAPSGLVESVNTGSGWSTPVALP